ncbi:MAG: rRNA maturation RNase YbeY [Eubacterium sp.]|nr:rRNA maturation RNase YbeY [Eubacterium sp.]
MVQSEGKNEVLQKQAVTEVIFDTGVSLPFEAEPLMQMVAEEVLRSEHCPFSGQVSITFVSNEMIREQNLAFRGIDAATDVLSFPLVPFPEPSDYSLFKNNPASDCFDPETGALCLGDILISVERASEQAEEYGHSLKREIAFLTAHSMLHLLGYDHETEEEAAVMEEKQEAVLRKLGITRDLPD